MAFRILHILLKNAKQYVPIKARVFSLFEITMMITYYPCLFTPSTHTTIHCPAPHTCKHYNNIFDPNFFEAQHINSILTARSRHLQSIFTASSQHPYSILTASSILLHSVSQYGRPNVRPDNGATNGAHREHCRLSFYHIAEVSKGRMSKHGR